MPAWSSPASPLPVQGQDLDTGAKVVHAGADTYQPYINTKSHLQATAASAPSAASVVVTDKDAKGSKSCGFLRIPDAGYHLPFGHDPRHGRAHPPMLTWATKPSIGRISDDAVFYLMSRGIPEEEARAMIVERLCG